MLRDAAAVPAADDFVGVVDSIGDRSRGPTERYIDRGERAATQLPPVIHGRAINVLTNDLARIVDSKRALLGHARDVDGFIDLSDITFVLRAIQQKAL